VADIGLDVCRTIKIFLAYTAAAEALEVRIDVN